MCIHIPTYTCSYYMCTRVHTYMHKYTHTQTHRKGKASKAQGDVLPANKRSQLPHYMSYI